MAKANLQPSFSNELIYRIAFCGLAVLLFFPPYFRGLFFAAEQEKALLFAALVFWLVFVWRWLQGDHKFLATPLDYFALALPVAYVFSSFVAVNKGLAVEEVVNNILYFLTFWSVSRVVRHQRDAESILKVIYISAVGVAMTGLASATGIIDIKDGFKNGRIFSTYQYPNALAALLGGVTFMGTYLWHRSGEQYKEALELTKNTILLRLYRLYIFSYLYTAGNFLLLAALFGTKSRGGLLVFALVLLIYFIGIRAEKRLASALHLGYLGVLAFIVADRFIPLAQVEQTGQTWFWIIGGLLLALAGQAVFILLQQRILPKWADNKKKLSLSFGFLAGVAVVAAGIWFSSNNGVINRLVDANYLASGMARIRMMETAFKMTIDRPILGWGGGGWQEAYKVHMDYRLTSSEVHSYYFQLGVETGFLGLLIIAGIFVSFLYLAHGLYYRSKEKPSQQHLIWILTNAFLMIAGHALIDFDLSLSALTIVLWSIFGIIAGLTRGEPIPAYMRERKKRVPQDYIPLGVATTLIIIIFISGFFLVQSRNMMRQGIELIKSQQIEEGLVYIEKARSYAPFKAEYHITLSQIYNILGKKDKAIDEARQGVRLSQYDIQPRNNLIIIAFAVGDYQEAAETASRTIELAPNEITVYETYGMVLNKLGLEELKAGNKAQAKEYFAGVLETPDLINKRVKNLDETDEKMWIGSRLIVTREINLYIGKASYWLGDFEAAEENLTQAMKDKSLEGDAMMYMAMLNEKQGNRQKAEELLKQAEKATSGIKQQYESLIELQVLQ